MKKVAFNIGYKGISSGILSYYPFVWDNCDFRIFSKKIRQKGNIKQLFKWAKNAHVPPSTIVLFLRIENETEYWEFSIKMINVREYRKYWEEVYKKTWKST